MIRLLCLLIGYIFGVFQTAFFYGKLKGIDIREHGSGNAGTTNTLRVLGTKAGLIVFAGDMLKCIIAIVLTKVLFKNTYGEILPLLSLYTGAGCILGHNFPFYMNFKGGKGIAATGGMMIALHWMYIPVGLIVFFGTFALTHFVSLGSLLLYLSFVVETILMGEFGFFGVSRPILIEMYVIVVILMALAYFMHRSNISRLIHGNERKTYLFKKKKESEAENK